VYVYFLDKDNCKSSFLIVKQFVHIQSIKKIYSVYFSIIYSANGMYLMLREWRAFKEKSNYKIKKHQQANSTSSIYYKISTIFIRIL